MSMLNHELARAIMNDRLAEAEGRRRQRAVRRTRPAAKAPEPTVRRSPGLLSRIFPAFGGRVSPA